MQKPYILLIAASLMLAGCATPTYREVLKKTPDYNKKEFAVSKEVVFKAAAKVICLKGFMLEKEDENEGFILGKRYFKRGKKNIILALQAKVISDQENKSTLYLTAMETTENSYVADRTRFFLFLIPLPGGGGKEASTIKEGEKMVEDRHFYNSLLSLIENEIKK